MVKIRNMIVQPPERLPSVTDQKFSGLCATDKEQLVRAPESR